jgi:hypothetical protein
MPIDVLLYEPTTIFDEIGFRELTRVYS